VYLRGVIAVVTAVVVVVIIAACGAAYVRVCIFLEPKVAINVLAEPASFVCGCILRQGIHNLRSEVT
jgi:apolipoprotein N-acyltransferase